MKPAEIERNKFFEFAGFKPYDVIWDFGCGEGRYTKALENMPCKVYATDKDFGEPPTKQVDKVLLACVLHYNEDKSWILFEAWQQLKPGGHIVIIEPNPFNPFFYCLYFWRWLIRSKCPRRWHNEKYMSMETELKSMLATAGFKNIQTKKYAWFPSKFGWLRLNEWLNRMPILNIMNAFNWVRGKK